MRVTDRRRTSDREFAFDPVLIGQLKADHQMQIQYAVVIIASAHAAQFGRTLGALSEFRKHLQDHIVKEDSRLYGYLAYYLKDDAQRQPMMAEARSEMASIGREVMRCVQKYDDIGIDADNVEVFQQEFGEMLQRLAKRNDCEENSLYPLYLYPSVVMASRTIATVHEIMRASPG